MRICSVVSVKGIRTHSIRSIQILVAEKTIEEAL